MSEVLTLMIGVNSYQLVRNCLCPGAGGGSCAQARGFVTAGNTKGGSITVLLTSCLTGLESAV